MALALFHYAMEGMASAQKDAFTLQITVNDADTGTPPFNTKGNCPGNTPGDDCGFNDRYVRTSDTIGYRFDYKVNPMGVSLVRAENVTIVSTLPSNPEGSIFTEWKELPSCCTGPGSSISQERQMLTCNLGPLMAGSNGNFLSHARVRGDALNGWVAPVFATISADGVAPPVDSNTVTDTVSAAPKLDVRGSHDGILWYTAPGPCGATGYLVRYPLTILNRAEKGSEIAGGDIVFVDDLSQHTANAQLYTFDGKPACAINGEGRRGALPNIPYGRIGAHPDAITANSVTNSGSLTCNQPGGPGTPVIITITGADTSAVHTPTQMADGTPIPPADRYVFAGEIDIWVPDSDIIAAGGELWVTNCYTRFDPVSPTAQSNYLDGSEPDYNNCKRHKLPAVDGAMGNAASQQTTVMWYGSHCTDETASPLQNGDLIQLIRSPDDTISPPNPITGLPTGNDGVADTKTYHYPGDPEIGDYFWGDYWYEEENYYVWVRIWNDSDPGAATCYWDSPVYQATGLDPIDIDCSGATTNICESAPTETPTGAPTMSPTLTPTELPTDTPTISPTPTPSRTPTETPIPPTALPTQTPTKTPTNTPAATSTPTSTRTPTATPLPTVKPSGTATPVGPVEIQTPTPTPTPVPDAQVLLNGESFTSGNYFSARFKLNKSIQRVFAAYAVVIFPNNVMLNALTLDTPLKPVVTNMQGLEAPFSYPLISASVPIGTASGTYEVVVAFFDQGKLIRSREDAFLDASAKFAVR